MTDSHPVARQLHDFLCGCARAMALCAEDGLQRQMVDHLSRVLAQEKFKPFTPNPVACLDSLQWIRDMKLAKDFQQFALDLPWRHSPRNDDEGTEMALVDLSDVFELDGVIAGLMYVDAHRAYPEHSHPPGELYFLISGTAHWRYGGHSDYREIAAGNLIYNHPHDRHGVRAGSAPVLALYVLCPRLTSGSEVP